MYTLSSALMELSIQALQQMSIEGLASTTIVREDPGIREPDDRSV